MRQREPTTQIMKASEVRQKWSKLLNQVFRKEVRVLVEKSGIPVAAIISAESLEYLQQIEAQREKDFKALDGTREAFADLPDEELVQEVTRAVAAVRRQNRKLGRLPAPSS